MFHSRPRRVAFALAAILTVSAAGSAAAATTADVSESFTITSTLALTLDRASIDYGSIDPGGTTMAPTPDRTVHASVTANGAWTLAVTGSAFARTGGGSMPASARAVKVNNGPTWDPLPANVNGSGAGNPGFEFAVNAPPNATAGSYSGTITFTVTSN